MPKTEEEKKNLDRINELVGKATSNGGLESLSHNEVKELFIKSLGTTQYIGDAAPLFLAELNSRRATISNRIAMGISGLAIICSLASIYLSSLDGHTRDSWRTEQLAILKQQATTLEMLPNEATTSKWHNENVELLKKQTAALERLLVVSKSEKGEPKK